jgi:hypothetical protein
VSQGTLNLKTPNAVTIRPKSNPTSAVKTVVYKDMVMATPSVGTSFQISMGDLHLSSRMLDISNATGILVRQVPLTGTMDIDISDLTDGVYFLSVELNDGAIARQKIIVQH